MHEVTTGRIRNLTNPDNLLLASIHIYANQILPAILRRFRRIESDCSVCAFNPQLAINSKNDDNNIRILIDLIMMWVTIVSSLHYDSLQSLERLIAAFTTTRKSLGSKS